VPPALVTIAQYWKRKPFPGVAINVTTVPSAYVLLSPEGVVVPPTLDITSTVACPCAFALFKLTIGINSAAVSSITTKIFDAFDVFNNYLSPKIRVLADAWLLEDKFNIFSYVIVIIQPQFKLTQIFFKNHNPLKYNDSFK
jgi:hypothetical protein